MRVWTWQTSSTSAQVSSRAASASASRSPRALANDPLVILADEPTGNLDSVSSTNVRDILHDLTRGTGKTVVAVTHDSNFASVADRCIGIVDGRIDLAWRPAPG